MENLLGAHVSIAGGIDNAPDRAKELGCNTMQIFSRNQRMWKAKPLLKEKVITFKRKINDYKIQKISIHASYLINLATNIEEKLQKSLNAMEDELLRGDILEVPYFVIHPGSAIGISEKEGLDNIIKNISFILGKIDPKIKILFETTAGQGNNLGYTFEQLAYLLKNIGSHNIGICFDTCHVFSAGYDLKDQYDKVFEQFNAIIGLEKLFVFHINDSKTEFASRKDRHENIGKGSIGLEFFNKLVNDKRFKNIPMILETPGGDEFYKNNLKLLRRFING